MILFPFILPQFHQHPKLTLFRWIDVFATACRLESRVHRRHFLPWQKTVQTHSLASVDHYQLSKRSAHLLASMLMKGIIKWPEGYRLKTGIHGFQGIIMENMVTEQGRWKSVLWWKFAVSREAITGVKLSLRLREDGWPQRSCKLPFRPKKHHLKNARDCVSSNMMSVIVEGPTLKNTYVYLFNF